MLIAQQQPNRQSVINAVSVESRAWEGQCWVLLTQVMANNCMHLDTLAKHRALNSKEYTDVVSVLTWNMKIES